LVGYWKSDSGWGEPSGVFGGVCISVHL
jgi:hypothetical protein